MASIRQREGKWQARVRRKGFPDEVRTFPSRQDAERWARSVESDIDKGSYRVLVPLFRVGIESAHDRVVGPRDQPFQHLALRYPVTIDSKHVTR